LPGQAARELFREAARCAAGDEGADGVLDDDAALIDAATKCDIRSTILIADPALAICAVMGRGAPPHVASVCEGLAGVAARDEARM
jgi:hypothetical protein